MSRATKWAPAALVATLITAGSIAIPLQAAAVDLPSVTADELMAMMNPDVTGFSGTVEKTSDLGLPALEMSSLMSPAMAEEMAEKMPEGLEDFVPQLIEQNLVTEAIAFVAGTDTIRVFASEEGFRAQILDPMSQRDIVVSQTEFWSYNAATQTALTREITTDVTREDIEEKLGTLEVDVTDPRALADFLLEQAGDDTQISVGKDHRVADRTAYTLSIEPLSANSLVALVDVSIDSENGMPLGVQVYSSEQTSPALSVAFTSISFEVPDASLFSFTPPPGTTVEVIEVPESLEKAFTDAQSGALAPEDQEQMARELQQEFAPGSEVTVIGERYDTVVSMTNIPKEYSAGLLDNELFQELLVTVQGGQVFSTPLFNVMITDSGSVLAGAVTIDYLVSVAQR